MRHIALKPIVTVAMVLALCVVALGAYTRLTHAGLGCPDWPGCYGHWVLPSTDHALTDAQAHFPSQPIEAGKAWTEMIHRYAAGVLATLIFIILALSWLGRCRSKESSISTLPILLSLLVVFQALLGMWTVTLKLLPLVVMLHLMGGILIFSCLSTLRVQLAGTTAGPVKPIWRPLAALGLFIILLQIALGGWVSANYAGIACIGFPRCNGQWLPSLNLAKSFYLLAPVGQNYQGGVLDSEVRASIQYIHRIGALATFIYMMFLGLSLLRYVPDRNIQRVARVILLLLILQIFLGIINVTYLLPLPIAVAHNVVAALLAACAMILFYLLSKRR